MDELEVLKLAENIEDEGYRFYTGMADAFHNTELAEAFRRLADAEENHRALFRKIYDQILASKKPYDDAYLYDPDVERYLRLLVETSVFPRGETALRELGPVKSLQEVLNIAIRAEKDSILFFAEIAGNAQSDATREVALKIIEEEKGHLHDLSQALAGISQAQKAFDHFVKG